MRCKYIRIARLRSIITCPGSSNSVSLNIVKDAFDSEPPEHSDVTKPVKIVAGTSKRGDAPTAGPSSATEKHSSQVHDLPSLRELLAMDQKALANWIIKYFISCLSTSSDCIACQHW